LLALLPKKPIPKIERAGERAAITGPISLTVIGAPACTVMPMIAQNQPHAFQESVKISLAKYSGERERQSLSLAHSAKENGGLREGYR
jgi:hypothetical protein